MLDVLDLIAERGGNPEVVRESQRVSRLLRLILGQEDGDLR